MIQANHFKRHSRLGVASTVIGGGLPLLLIILMIISLALSVDYNYKSDFIHSLGHISDKTIGIVALLALPLHLLGLIFALIGISSKKTKRFFPIAGIVLNLLFGLIGIAIAILLFFALLSIGFH